MSYRVEFTTAAVRQIRKLPRGDRQRVLAATRGLQDEPRPHGARGLTGYKNAWRIRVGVCRVIYEVADVKLTVTVVHAGHRREVYGR